MKRDAQKRAFTVERQSKHNTIKRLADAGFLLLKINSILVTHRSSELPFVCNSELSKQNLKGIIMKELIGLLQGPPPSDMFDAEMFGEWFVNGELEDKHFERLNPEKVDDTYDSIEERYGLVWAQRFDERALPLVSI